MEQTETARPVTRNGRPSAAYEGSLPAVREVRATIQKKKAEAGFGEDVLNLYARLAQSAIDALPEGPLSDSAVDFLLLTVDVIGGARANVKSQEHASPELVSRFDTFLIGFRQTVDSMQCADLKARFQQIRPGKLLEAESAAFARLAKYLAYWSYAPQYAQRMLQKLHEYLAQEMAELLQKQRTAGLPRELAGVGDLLKHVQPLSLGGRLFAYDAFVTYLKCPDCAPAAEVDWESVMALAGNGLLEESAFTPYGQVPQLQTLAHQVCGFVLNTLIEGQADQLYAGSVRMMDISRRILSKQDPHLGASVVTAGLACLMGDLADQLSC
jgi:hypothetical protein